MENEETPSVEAPPVDKRPYGTCVMTTTGRWEAVVFRFNEELGAHERAECITNASDRHEAIQDGRPYCGNRGIPWID